MLKSFFLAMQFLTRLPVPSSDDLPDEAHGRMVLFYPLVGLLIGSLLSLGYYLIGNTSNLLQAALLLMVWVAITGALHIDGLADLTDAWVGGHGDKARTLEILKDSRSGPMAVTVVVLLLLIKFAALESLLSSGVWSALLLVPLIGRAGLVASLLYLPYVRPEGLGAMQASHLPKDQARNILLASLLFCFLFWGWDTLLVLLAIIACFMLLRQSLIDRLGGLTGDAAGAICELLEVTALVTLALLL